MSDTQSLYGFRPLLNASDLIEWAKSVGFETTLLPDDMHVTVVYSRTPLPVPQGLAPAVDTIVVRGGNRKMMSLGDGSAATLVIDSVDLISEWNYYRSIGASWDYPSYMPHVTISYKGGPVDIEPYTGDLVFGPIEFRALNDKSSSDYLEKSDDGAEIDNEDEKQGLLEDVIHAILQFVMDNYANISSDLDVIKMDDEQMLVWGWASVATENGEDVYDSHGDHIPMSELTKASIDFMENVRVGKTMHSGEKTSTVIGCLPLSAELAKALGIESKREGLIMGFKVHDRKTWDLIKSGELPALSIGGRGMRYAVK